MKSGDNKNYVQGDHNVFTYVTLAAYPFNQLKRNFRPGHLDICAQDHDEFKKMEISLLKKNKRINK